ncbi:MAG: hypothetical protein RSE32_08155 [Comamonas sp.]|uniref:hypothetical protein n=1 Tax=Comamonas sp. TaxID=34028 RepID=UPI002FCA48B4
MMVYLRFADEASALRAIEAATWPAYIGSAAVDVVGVIYRPTGAQVSTPDGYEPEFGPVPGWHVNLSERVPALQDYEIDPPATPDRVFAGGDQVDMPRVPAKVTRRQARQALLLAGLLDKVQPAIDAIPDPIARQLAQIEWDDSQDFERERPLLVQLGYALGLDDSGLDAIFIQAGGL